MSNITKHLLRHDKEMLYTLSFVMWTMIVISFFAVIFTLFHECFPCDFKWTSKGIAYFISMFLPFHHLFSRTIMLMTIYVALVTYVRNKKVEAMKALQDLRSMLMQGDNVKIHDLLEYDEDNPQEKEKKITDFQNEFADRQGCVYNYMGILELAKFYLDEGIITKEQFIDQFGYRVENIYANPLINAWINKHPCYWKTLNSLYKIMIEK